MENDERKQYEKLIKLLEKHNKLYYVDNKPIISDYEYDMLVQKVKTLGSKIGKASTVFRQIGSDLNSRFKKIKHRIPMLSLNNTYNIQEFNHFINRHDGGMFVIQDKVDGLSLSLRYVDGKLKHAVTRGDGETGDDVTENALRVMGVKKTLPGNLTATIRGEVCIYHKDFKDINKKGEFSNPRNLASGTLKTLDNPKLISKRKLRFLAYRYLGDLDSLSEQGQINLLETLGFTVPWTKSVRLNLKQQGRNIKMLNNYEECIRYKDYPIDGLVIKVNDTRKQRLLGESKKAPRWAIAYKFNSGDFETTLLDVKFSVSRAGVVTPIAILEPVEITGSIVSRSTLHNKNYINHLKLRIGDKIGVIKGGEIIPKVTSVIKSNNGKLVKYPSKCPVCKSILDFSDDTRIICPDTFGNCQQKVERLIHFSSKQSLDIQGLGEAVCKNLMDKFVLDDITEIFYLTKEQLETLPGFRQKSAHKLYDNIQKAFSKPMQNWLYSFGIPGIGFNTAEVLCNKFRTWNKLTKATLQSLISIPGIGESTAKPLLLWLSSPDNLAMIKRLKRQGMPRSYVSKQVNPQFNKLNGLKVVITGSFGAYKRSFLEARVNELGGTFQKSVRSDTTHLFCGDNVGKNKINQAQINGIEIYTLDEALNILEL